MHCDELHLGIRYYLFLPVFNFSLVKDQEIASRNQEEEKAKTLFFQLRNLHGNHRISDKNNHYGSNLIPDEFI